MATLDGPLNPDFTLKRIPAFTGPSKLPQSKFPKHLRLLIQAMMSNLSGDRPTPASILGYQFLKEIPVLNNAERVIKTAHGKTLEKYDVEYEESKKKKNVNLALSRIDGKLHIAKRNKSMGGAVLDM